MKLKWIDIDTERRTISITPSKGSNPRILPISEKLKGMLSTLKRKTEKLCTMKKHSLRTSYEELRKRTATKLNNPRINKITLHTFRHFKGTTEYHKTKDIIHVKTVLGHKSITSTMVYINIEQAIFLNQTDEFTAKIAHNETEAIQLIETGFEFICDMNGTKLFRKRK
jgi:integrase